MSLQVDCFESQNVLCKHHRATVAYYVNFDSRLETGVTIDTCQADTADDDLEIVGCEVLEENVDLPTGCNTTSLLVGRAVKLTLAGGVPSEDEVIVTVRVDTSDDQSDFVDCRLLIGGAIVP